MEDNQKKLDKLVDEFEKGVKDLQASSICAICIPGDINPIPGTISFVGNPNANERTYPQLLTNIIRVMCKDDTERILGMLNEMKSVMEKSIKENK